MRIIVGITGASGAVYGIRLLEELKARGVETHLIVSKWAEKTLEYEMEMTREEAASLSDVCYDVDDLAAAVSSGSFRCDGMVIAPCSMKTLASIAGGCADNLIARAADVTLKERRRLILVPRESPLSLIHVRNMLTVTEAGAILVPPTPAFYTNPKTLDDFVDQVVSRVMDMLDIPNELTTRWG